MRPWRAQRLLKYLRPKKSLWLKAVVVLLTLPIQIVFRPRTINRPVSQDEKPGDSTTAGPVIFDSGPDADEYGAAEEYPIGGRSTFNLTRYLVGSYSHFYTILPTRTVDRAREEWSFDRAPNEPAIRYLYRGKRLSLADYLARNPVTGLLIAKDNLILAERYQYNRTDHDLFMSQSMVKTITAMRVGIAVSEDLIRSVDDTVATYVPELRQTEYGATSIRDLLHMSSGIAFREEYDESDDISRLGRDLLTKSGKTMAEIIGQSNVRVAPAGTRFQYAGIETEILCFALRSVTNRSLSHYLSDKIWQPIQAESVAFWGIDEFGMELAYCCFNTVLRDYARLARLLASDGIWQGREIIPRQWIIDATTVHPSGSAFGLR